MRMMSLPIVGVDQNGSRLNKYCSAMNKSSKARGEENMECIFFSQFKSVELASIETAIAEALHKTINVKTNVRVQNVKLEDSQFGDSGRLLGCTLGGRIELSIQVEPDETVDRFLDKSGKYKPLK